MQSVNGKRVCPCTAAQSWLLCVPRRVGALKRLGFHREDSDLAAHVFHHQLLRTRMSGRVSCVELSACVCVCVCVCEWK
jgi:hypothetical protein